MSKPAVKSPSKKSPSGTPHKAPNKLPRKAPPSSAPQPKTGSIMAKGVNGANNRYLPGEQSSGEEEQRVVREMADAIENNFGQLPPRMVIAACGVVIASVMARRSPFLPNAQASARAFGEDMAQNIARNWSIIEAERREKALGQHPQEAENDGDGE